MWLQVSWAFIVFDNTMVQLVHYTSLKEVPLAESMEENEGSTRPPPMPHMDMMGTKLAFWVKDTVNMTEYADKLEDESRSQGFSKVGHFFPLLCVMFVWWFWFKVSINSLETIERISLAPSSCVVYL